MLTRRTRKKRAYHDGDGSVGIVAGMPVVLSVLCLVLVLVGLAVYAWRPLPGYACTTAALVVLFVWLLVHATH